jgi:diguanylate cyclase (GGDEF)-like protein
MNPPPSRTENTPVSELASPAAERRQIVLVVDDDAIVRLMAGAALEEAGFSVVEADSAEEGLARFRRQPVDLVLLDVMLPGMNGFDACARLRADPGGANVPIIVMTGLDDQRSIAGAYEAGATDFITKPIVWNLLPYRVRYALRASAALQETARSRSLLSRSQTLAQMGSWEWSRAGDSVIWSEEMHRVHGTEAMAATLVCSEALLAMAHPQDRERLSHSLALAKAQGLAYGIEFRIVRPDGVVRHLSEQTDIERDVSGAVCAVRGIRQDITQRTEADERIRTLAYTDPLTGLANRALFRDKAVQWLAYAARHGARCAVLVVDLDRFKAINDTLGPRVGDEVLRIVSERLRSCLRESDTLGLAREAVAEGCLARLGADEFTLLLVEINEPTQASLVARRVIDSLTAPLQVEGHELNIGARVGISMTPDDGDDVDVLLRHAGTAMSAAKRDTQQRVRFYDSEMGAEVGRKLRVESELRRALDQGELRLFYQPKVDLRSVQVVGAEALVRWLHPTRGMMSPLEFIPVAEESGLIVPLTRWVISEACRQVAQWRTVANGVPVSINLDAASLQGNGLATFVQSELARWHLPAAAIAFEVTETSLMRDLDRAGQTLSQLRQLGVKLLLDDFGTGHSSLTYLKRFPFDVLKIDRSFVKDLPGDSNDAALTTAIIAMAQSLHLSLVAEGVETWEQAAFLMERGCHVAQGFLFAKPLPGPEYAALVALGLQPKPQTQTQAVPSLQAAGHQRAR